MASNILDDLIRTIVNHYGFEKINLALRKLEREAKKHEPKPAHQISLGNHESSSQSEYQNRQKKTALSYVEKLNPASDIQRFLNELAQMFDDKNFLGTIGEIRDFCALHNIDVPVSSSRATSIPRIFRTLAMMSVSEIQKVMQSARFSGPSHLAPIAAAIRRNSNSLRLERQLPKKEKGKPAGEDEGKSGKPENPTALREI